MICDHTLTSDTDVHFVLNYYHPADSTYTVWQLVRCDISLYIFTIHYNVIWKSYISFYVICLPSYRPYNLLEKKDLRNLLCMLCNLCFVSVKKVEKRVSWLLVSVEMAPSEIVFFYFLWKITPSSGTAKRYGSQAMITSGPVLRPPAHPHRHAPPTPPTPRHRQYQHSDTSMQAPTHTHTHPHTHTHTHTQT